MVKDVLQGGAHEAFGVVGTVLSADDEELDQGYAYGQVTVNKLAALSLLVRLASHVALVFIINTNLPFIFLELICLRQYLVHLIVELSIFCADSLRAFLFFLLRRIFFTAGVPVLEPRGYPGAPARFRLMIFDNHLTFLLSLFERDDYLLGLQLVFKMFTAPF